MNIEDFELAIDNVSKLVLRYYFNGDENKYNKDLQKVVNPKVTSRNMRKR